MNRISRFHRRRALVALAKGALFGLATAGCGGSDDAEPAAPAGPTPGASEGGPLPSDPPGAEAPPLADAPLQWSASWTSDTEGQPGWEADAPHPPLNSAWIRGAPSPEGDLTISVWVHVTLAMGIAFRVDYDPAVLEFVGHLDNGAFGAAGGRGVEMARVIRPGQVAWGGARFPDNPNLIETQGNAPLANRRLALLRFRVLGTGTTRVDFSPFKREVRMRDDSVIDEMQWYGGTLRIEAAAPGEPGGAQ